MSRFRWIPRTFYIGSDRHRDGRGTMALTRDAQETIKARANADPEFRRALVEEAAECMRTGDAETAKALMKRLRPSRSSG